MLFRSTKEKTLLEYVQESRKDNRFLSFDDFAPHEKRKYVIADVGRADVNGHEKDALKLKGEDKIFTFGAENRERLIKLFPAAKAMKDLIGKPITIYANPNIKFKGEQVGGMVIQK